MVAGLRDGLAGSIVRFSGPLGGWLLLKVVLATLLLVVYGLFMTRASRKKTYLQEDRTTMAWCLGTQAVGIVLVGIITAIGTMLVYYPDRMPRFPIP